MWLSPHPPPASVVVGDYMTDVLGPLSLGCSDILISRDFFHDQNHSMFSNKVCPSLFLLVTLLFVFHYYITYCSYEMVLFICFSS